MNPEELKEREYALIAQIKQLNRELFQIRLQKYRKKYLRGGK